MAERLFNVNLPYSHNRAQRRKAEGADFRGQIFWKEKLGSLARQLEDSAISWNQSVKSEGKDVAFAKTVYGDNFPFIHDYLVTRKPLVTLIDEIHRLHIQTGSLNPDFLNNLDGEDIFSVKLGRDEISLSDIEKMPLPLSLANIKSINRMFRQKTFSRSTRQEHLIRQSMIFLALSHHIWPETSRNIPSSIRPLTERMCDWLDYYCDLLTNASLSPSDESNLLLSIAYTGPYLMKALGSYFPARLGISSSSALKFYSERAQNSSLPDFGFKMILNQLTKETREAIRKSVIPEELQDFLLFDKKIDEKVQALLLASYGTKFFNESEAVRLYEENDNTIRSLIENWKRVTRVMSDNSKKYLSILLPNGSFAKEMIIAQQYRKTLIFILKFTDSETHLTIEIDQNGSVWGFPTKLTMESPLVRERVLADILEAAKGEFALSSKAMINQPMEPFNFPLIIIDSSGRRPKFNEIETVKVKPDQMVTRVSHMPIVQHEPVTLPVRSDSENKPKFRVIYSRSKVVEAFVKSPRPKDVDRVIRIVRRFECDHQAKIIEWSGGKRQVLRAGDLRIALNHLGGGVFNLESIGDREYVYRRYGDYKGK